MTQDNSQISKGHLALPDSSAYRNLGDIHQFVQRSTGSCAKQMEFMLRVFPVEIIGKPDSQEPQAASVYKWWENSVQRTNAFKGSFPNRWQQRFTRCILSDISVYRAVFIGYSSLLSEIDPSSLQNQLLTEFYRPDAYPDIINTFLKDARAEEILTVMTLCALITVSDEMEEQQEATGSHRHLPIGITWILLKRIEERAAAVLEVAQYALKKQTDGQELTCNFEVAHSDVSCALTQIMALQRSDISVQNVEDGGTEYEERVRSYSEALHLWSEAGGSQFALNQSKVYYKDGLLAMLGLNRKTPDGINYAYSFQCFRKADALVMENRRDFPLPASQLAHLYYTGKGGDEGNIHDYQKAFRYARCAADAGSAEGQALLSMMYRIGIGCDKDFDKAIKHARAAFQKGNSSQCYMIAREAERKPQYEKIAIEFYNNIKEIYPAAAYRLGLLYKDKDDIDLALQCLHLAVDRKEPDADALNELGQMHFTGIRSEVSFTSAYNYFERAASYQNTQSIYMLGYMELHGLGRVPDWDKAEQHFLAASRRGYVLATKELFKLYLNRGKLKEALEIAEISEDSGGVMNLLLGISYKEGLSGAAVDLDIAERYFYRARERKNEDVELFLNSEEEY